MIFGDGMMLRNLSDAEKRELMLSPDWLAIMEYQHSGPMMVLACGTAMLQ
jgi:hypothetical protein